MVIQYYLVHSRDLYINTYTYYTYIYMCVYSSTNTTVDEKWSCTAVAVLGNSNAKDTYDRIRSQKREKKRGK